MEAKQINKLIRGGGRGVGHKLQSVVLRVVSCINFHEPTRFLPDHEFMFTPCTKKTKFIYEFVLNLGCS